MQIAKSLLLTVVTMNLVACSTIRLNYDAKVKNDKGETARYNYQKSYKITASAIVCGVTAVIYGGWCWSYLFRPFANDITNVSTDASIDLETKHAGYHVVSENVTRESWKGGSPIVDFTPDAPTDAKEVVKP